ncbi:hypothetical protein LWC08_10205 [Desulfobaculum bizertense]|uniref:hypothetical protein n=1 Tax=Desulfobaculum bizertense TaxID=376490 RepID=UPI001F473293|nr:hypothetical protein [Desulfobaculum bizertense]UIJ37104.1 hypothetical protein LWC08_10205 [Desulfobaculum bizertense]
MKKISLTLLFLWICTPVFAANFINPIGFTPNKENKAAVVEFVQQNTRQSAAVVGIDSESTLRMMEQQNLNAFKKLVSAQDKATLKRVIKNCHQIGINDYSTIYMMYEQEIKAKSKSLQW